MPLADFEVSTAFMDPCIIIPSKIVLPEQKPKPQPFDFVKIVLAIVLGLAAIYSEV